MSTYKPHKPTFAFTTEEVDANPIEPTLGVAPTTDVEKPDEALLKRIEMERSLRELSLGDPIGRIRDDLRKKGINPVSTDYVRDATDKAVKAREFFDTTVFDNDTEGLKHLWVQDDYVDLTQPVTNVPNFDKRVDQYISSGLAEEVKDASGRRVGIKIKNNGDISLMIDSAYKNIEVPEAMSDVAQSNYFSELTRNVISQLPVNDKGEIEYNGVPYHWAELYEAFYPVVADRAHEALLENNKGYYNWAFEQSMGMSYEDWYKGYADKRVSEIEQKIIELRDAVAEETAQIAEGEGREVALSSGTLVPASLLGWASKEGARVEASKQFNDVLESINTFRNNDFKSGLNEGFDWADALTLGIADLGTSYSQLQLLEKAKRGEPLSNSESKVLELLQLTQEFEGIKKSLGWERNLRSSVGSGLGSTLAMAPSFALGMAGTSRIGTTVKLAANVAKNASRKAAIKQVGKSFIHNLGTSLMRGATVAPLMPSTYSTGLKELQEQYTFNPDGTIKFEPKSKALAFMGGYIDTMSEYASEVFGSTLGEIIGYGARAFGRVTRLNKVVDAVMEPVNTGLGKAIDKGLSYIPIEDEAKLAGVRKALRGMIVPNAELDEETKELMRMWGVQDGYVAEAASEVFGDLMSQVMRDIVGAKTDYSDFKDSTYWGTQLLVSVLYGGSMNTLAHIKEGVSDYQQLVDLGKYKKNILDKIESRELRNKVLAITADGSIEDMAKQLADIEWEKYHATDRAKVMDYIRAEMQIQVTAGNVEENGRVEAFVKEAARLSGVTYQGKGGLIMETTVGGRQYYIIDGKPADRSDSSMLTCIDKETGERKAILSKSLPEQPVTRTYNEVLQDVYTSRFSVSAEATRISALQSAYGQMERPTAEIARDMMKQMGITPPAEGDVITMSDGRKAKVTQDLENGSYVVRLEGQVPLLFTIPFYSIQSSNPLTAEAQKSMIEGKVGSAANKAADVSAMEVENGDVTEETMVQPTQSEVTPEASEAEMQSAETMTQTEEQIANDTLDMTNVPVDAEGNVDYDAIDDPAQYAQLYAHEAGSKAEAAKEVEELKRRTLEEAAKLEEASKNEITASAKRKKLKEAKKLRERAAFYDKVLPQFEEMEEEYTSVVKNEYSQQVAEPTLRVLDAMARKLGIKVRFVDEVNEGKANAQITKDGYVEIAFNHRDKSVTFLMGHEFTHRMQDLSPEQYAEFKQMVKDFIGEEKWNALVAQTAQAYAKQNVPFTEALIEDEVTADAAGELVESNDAFRKYLEGKKEDKTFLMKVAEFLRDMVTMFNTANDRERERQYLGLLEGVNKLIESAEKAEATSNGQRERFSIIGEQGASALDMAEEATTRLDNLAVAREMEERGDSALNIRMATGWERGADGLWRYEIEENIPKDFFTKNLDVETTLGEILGDDHQYFKAYPSLADIKVLFSSMSYNEAGMYGGYNPINRSLLMFNSGENLETFVHEIQHAIQVEEGFAIGGGEENFRFEGDTGFRQGQQYIPMGLILENITRKYVGKETAIKYGINSDFLNILDKEGLKESYEARKSEIPEMFHATLEDIINNPDIISQEQTIPIIQKVIDDAIAKAKDVAHSKYRRIAGEVESRNVEHRLNMTPEERRATLLSETEDVAREDQIFLREGAEMAMAKNVGLPKEEYAKLASTIMTHQHTYGRPPFDYAFTDGSFYVYDYLGDGDSIINFAMPIVGNEDLIQNITNSIDNGTITDTRSLDLYAENLQGKQRVNYRRFADAFKKRHGNRGYGVTFRGDSASNGGTYFEDSKRIGGDATTRGTSGSIDESANQELTTRFSLITPEMDASTSAPAAETQIITTSNGDMVADVNEATGQGRFSLRTYREGGRDVLADFLDTRVSDGALTEREASEMMQQMDDIYNLCMAMEDEYTPFGMWSEAKVMADENGNPVFSVIKANGDYAMNLDFSLVCKKRRTLDAVLNEMVKRGMIKGVSQKDTTIAKINEVIRKYGFETACALCFVDARRFQILRTARNFCNLYNDVVNLLIPKKRNIPVNEFNFAGRTDVSVAENSLDTMSDETLNVEAVRKLGYKVVGKTKDGKDIYAKTVLAKVARHLVEHPEDRRYLSPSDFVSTRGFDHVKQMKPLIMKLYNAKKGTGGPKTAYSDTQYLNDIIRSNWNVKDAYAVGGVRLQSFSDYVPRMVFDYIQMVAELAAKELPVHAYTKEPLFAKTFGLTGMKINLSLVPDVVEGGVAAGLDADGNYVWKQGETFPYEEAIALQDAEGYRDNCGTIAVGVSDAHILKMLDDPNIRMVIPYHKSGLPKQVAQMNNVSAFVDYTKVQNTTKNGVALTKEEAAKVPNYNELLREYKDARKAAKAYLDWCAERGYTPKFAQFASHPNYYKLLEDFTTMVNDRYVPQGAVTFTFPTEESAFGSLESLIEQGLEEDAVLEGVRDARVGAIVDEVGDVLGEKSDARYSIIGEIGAANLDAYGRYGSPMLALELAREFEAEGKSAKEIRLATNWERGKDGKWRYEIMDGVYNHPQDDDITMKEYRLADILDNPALYKAYPYLKDLKVTYNAELKPNGRYNGKSIELKSTRTPEQITSTLIHEVQHAIQYAEMFARGGSIASVAKELVAEGKQLAEEFKNTSNVDVIRKGYLLYQIAKKAWDIVKEDNKASEVYRSLAGEVEARNAQRRMGMTEEQRLETLLSATEDVSRDAQRMLFYEAKGGAEDARYSIINDMTEEDAYQASLLEEAMRMEREATSNGMDIAQEIADRTGWVHLANGEWKYYGEGKLDITDKASAERAAFRWLEAKKAVKKAQVRKTYAPIIKEIIRDEWSNNKEAFKKARRKKRPMPLSEEAKTEIARLEYERDAALAEIEAEYKGIFEDFDNNPDTYIREHQEAESYNANLDMYVGSLTKARKEVERLERQQAKRKLSDEEKAAAMRAVKAAVAKELRDGLGRYTRKYDIQRMMDAVSDARTPYAMLKAIDKAMESLFEIKWRREFARMQMLTKSKLSYGVTAIDASSFLNTFVSDHKITAADARKIMNDYWRGTKANGVSVATYIDDTTQRAMEFISEMAEYGKARAIFSDIEATEIIAFTRKLREKLENYTKLKDDYKFKTALANETVRKAIIDAVDILEMYWKAQELQLSLNDDKHRIDISALEIKAKEITAQLREVNQQIKDLADGKVVVTPSGVKDRGLLRKELQERYNTLLAQREEAYAEMYNAMPDIINLMQDANRAVETLLRTGKANLAAERTKRKEHEKKLIGEVLADLASPASLHKHHIDHRDKSVFERIATGIGSFIGKPLGSMDYMLRAIGRNAPLGEGRTYNRFAYAFQKAYDNIYTALEARKKMLDDKCNILWGENYHEVHKMAESTKVMTLTYPSATNTKDGGWKPVENTTDIYVTQAMYILAMWNQAEGRVTLEHQGFTEERINAIRDALNRVDARWIEFADWVVEEYLPSGRERYNAVHRDIFGTSMAAVPNYFPIKRAKEELQKEEDVAKGDVDLLPSTVVGAIKERTSNVVPIDLETSFFEALNENTSVMEAWAEMAGLIQDINTILSNGAVKKTMLDINDTLFSDFKKAAQVATLSYIGKTPDIDKKMGTILNRLWAGSKIAFRLNTAFKQLSSALLFAGYSTDPKFQAMLLWRYLGGVGKMPVALMNSIVDGTSRLTGHSLTNIDVMTNIEWAKANMPSFAKRWNEGVAGNELMARTTSGNTSWKQRAWYIKFDDAVRAVTKFGMKPNAFIDAFTSAAGARAVYDYTYEEMRKEGYSEEEAHTLAIINAEMAINTTQQSSEGLYLAPMQKDRSVVATTLSTFMNAPYAMFRNTMIGVKEILRDAKKELAEIESLEFKKAMDIAKKQVEVQVAAVVARGEYSEEEAKKRRDELFDSAKEKIIPLVKDRAYNKYVKAQTKAVVMVFLNGYAGQVAFNLMGKLAEFMFGDDDEEKKKMLYDIAVKSAWEAPVSMMPLGGYVTSMVNGYSASFFPAMDELSKEVISIVKGLREEDISPEVIYAATTMCMRWGLGLSVDTIVNIALGIENMFEDGMSAEAILKVMNAPEGQIRNIVGQRKEGETAKEYNERVMRFYSILDTPIYEDYFYTHGEKAGERRNEETPRGMFEKQMKRLKYEEAYRRSVVLHYGDGKQLAEIEDIRKAYNKLKAEGYGNMGEYRRKRLQKLTSQINDKEFGLMRRVGSDAAYYEQLLLVDAYKKRYIELYEQFK